MEIAILQHVDFEGRRRSRIGAGRPETNIRYTAYFWGKLCRKRRERISL